MIPPPPSGFDRETRGRVTLVARPELRDALERSGLLRPDGWRDRIAGSPDRPGRGATAVLDLDGADRLRIKQLRRGGAASRLWRERFPGPRRLMDNLRIPLEASRRGVSTPLPVALLLLEGPVGLFRGWLGLEEIAQATDLATRFASPRAPTREELDSALRTVRRMHDAGLDHRDLNLGNILVRDGTGEGPRAWVIDLDGARLLPGPLEFGARQRALRRLERSHVKACGSGTANDAVRDSFYELYAADDERLARRLERGRRVGRGWISVHRLGWRR